MPAAYPKISPRLRMLPMLGLLLLAACEKDTAQLVQEIDAAREGCTEEMLEAGAEECVQMFEKYIEMGTGAIETYIGAVRAFDAAVDRGPAVRFDTTGLGHAISPELLEAAPGQDAGTLPLLESAGGADEGPLYLEDGAVARQSVRSGPSYRPEYLEPDASRGAADEPLSDPSATYDSPRPPAPAAQQVPRRGALLPPEERLQRPWIGGDGRQEDYYPEAAPRREPVQRQTEDPKARRPEPSERPPL